MHGRELEIGAGWEGPRAGGEWTEARNRSQWRAFMKEAKSHHGMKRRDDDDLI